MKTVGTYLPYLTLCKVNAKECLSTLSVKGLENYWHLSKVAP